MMLLDLSRHTVRRNIAPYVGSFVALFLGVTLIGLLVTRDPKRLPMTPIVCTLMVFSAWMGITTIFSMWPDESVVMLNRRILPSGVR